MANIVEVKIGFISDNKDELKRFHNDLLKAFNKSLIENKSDFDDDVYVGNIYDIFNIKYSTDKYFRPNLCISKIDVLDNNSFKIYGWCKWGLQIKDIEALLLDYNDINYVYTEVDECFNFLKNTDTTGKLFPEKFLLEYDINDERVEVLASSFGDIIKNLVETFYGITKELNDIDDLYYTSHPEEVDDYIEHSPLKLFKEYFNIYYYSL